MNKILTLSTAILIAGCGPDPVETEKSANAPQFMAHTPRGDLYRFRVYGTGDDIYYFENSTNSITVASQRGKHRSIITIDGQKYQKVE